MHRILAYLCRSLSAVCYACMWRSSAHRSRPSTYFLTWHPARPYSRGGPAGTHRIGVPTAALVLESVNNGSMAYTANDTMIMEHDGANMPCDMVK